MTYYEDLSGYVVREVGDCQRRVNVGWLGKGHSFTTGVVSSMALSALVHSCFAEPIDATRGYRNCALCVGAKMVRLELVGHGSKKLGNAEVELAISDDILARSPNLIIHYVVDHGYCPPRPYTVALERKALALQLEPVQVRTTLEEWMSAGFGHRA